MPYLYNFETVFNIVSTKANHEPNVVATSTFSFTFVIEVIVRYRSVWDSFPRDRPLFECAFPRRDELFTAQPYTVDGVDHFDYVLVYQCHNICTHIKFRYVKDHLASRGVR